MRYDYPYELLPQSEGGFTVTFPDVPVAITRGDTGTEAAAMAEGCAGDRPFLLHRPRRTAARLRRTATRRLLPAVAAKVALHDAMIAAGVSNVALARQLGTDEKTVRRLRDPLHQSRINQVDAALRLLGKRMAIVIEAA